MKLLADLFYQWFRSNYMYNNSSPRFFPIFMMLLFTSIFIHVPIGSAQDSSSYFAEIGLEQLANIQVDILKIPEKLSQAPAAVFVITSEDIRRSGYTTIADVLRLVPGLQVARIDANKWAISSRGFNGVFANKLLVLIDGRSVYTPLFSGVFWEAQDVFLEDVDRIEVIRGPGATLWGANAVNGIINIVTKKAVHTEQQLLSIGGGSEERVISGFRYGGELNKFAQFRIWSKYVDRDNFIRPSGTTAADKWDVLRGGFRFDWNISEVNLLTVQGDLYHGTVGQMCNVILSEDELDFQKIDTTAKINGADLLCRWEFAKSPTSDMIFQFYFDRTYRHDVILQGTINTYDFDFQHELEFCAWHEMIWGLGYRYSCDDLHNTFSNALKPEQRSFKILSGFLQQEFKFHQNKLRFMVGSKFEKNDYTGLELQPNFRFSWLPKEKHSVWGAISRAVRIPSRVERDGESIRDVERFYGTPVLIVLKGSDNFKSERLLAHELGYRVLVAKQFAFDLALFYNNYDKLRTYEPTMEITP